MTSEHDDLGIRPYHETDEGRVLALLVTSLGGGPAGMRPPEFFRWKHLESPFGRSFMLVAEANGRIVGFRAFMRWRFRAGDRGVMAVRAVDTATHPDYQRKGIFSRLTSEALRELRGQIDLVFNTPNEKSLPGYLKLGWSVVGKIRPRVRVRRPLKVIRGLRSLRDLDTGGLDAAPPVEAEPASQLLLDENGLAELLTGGRAEQVGLHTARDVAYLRWRYGAAPLLDYRGIRIEGGGTLRGLALFRVRPRGTLWEAAVAELIVRPGDVWTASRLLREVLRSASVDHVTCRFPSGTTAAAAASKGAFLPAPGGATFVVNALRDEVRPDPTRIGAWGLTLGDLEVF